MSFSIESSEFVVLSCFDIKLDLMKELVREHFRDPARAAGFTLNEGKLDLNTVNAGRPYYGSRNPIKALIYQPLIYIDRCFFIANCSDGWHSMVYQLCKRFELDCISISTSSNDDEYPMNSIRVYQSGVTRRLVRAFKDGDRWDFFEKGDPVPFEQVENYKKRRIRDRLDREKLLTSVERAGLDLKNPGAWVTNQDTLYINECRTPGG